MNAEFLPDEVSYKDLKASITNARALRNTVNRLLRATRPGAFELVRQDDGSIVTKYERNEFRIMRSVRERKRSQEAKRKGVGKPDRSRIGTLAQASAAPDTRPASSFSARSLRRFLQTQDRIMNQSSFDRAKRYYDNYVRALDNVFGGFAEYEDRLDEIKSEIRSFMRSRTWGEVVEVMDRDLGIDFIYDPVARDAKFERIYEFWMEEV